jgi:hypothetical protein
MRRLASVLAALLALGVAPSARAEPLDLDLTRLGAPDSSVWGVLDPAADADRLARESRQRFAMLSSQLALALSSAVLQPASTTGYAGFDVGFEIATVAADSGAHGAPQPGVAGFSNQIWPTRGSQPSLLHLPSFHVRKALPWSFELGGRVIHLAQSSNFAAQGEAKWALNEGFEYLPDVALRAAYTQLFGEEDLNLGALDVGLLVSKRWSLNGVTSLTPYLAARFTRVSASSEQLDFTEGGTGSADAAAHAAFPHFTAGLYRTTLGLRFNAYALSLAMEATYFGGASPSDSDYEGVKLASAIGGAAKVGWEF